MAEDSLLLAGPQIPPTVLSLDYDQAIDHVPMALKQMNLPIMRPTATFSLSQWRGPSSEVGGIRTCDGNVGRPSDGTMSRSPLKLSHAHRYNIIDQHM